MDHALTSLAWNLLLAVLAIPLVAFVVQIFFGRRLPRGGDWLPTAGMFVVMCITVRMLFVALDAVGHGPFFHESVHEGGPVFAWFYQAAEKAPGLNVVAGVLYDGLGAAMLAGLAVGVFGSLGEIEKVWSEDQRFRPAMSLRAVNSHVARWHTAVAKS